MLPLEAYTTEQMRQCRKAAFFQNWRDLLFLHFATEPSTIQALLPDGLEIDTFPDSAGVAKAWVGLVPFRMQDVRPASLPGIPTATAFPETNVRTYVHINGRPGVWFFSLDATSRLACWGGRNLFHLPYHWSRMTVKRVEASIQYESKRRADGAHLQITAQFPGLVEPTRIGSLEFFLVERYLLFAKKGKRWFGGSVHHAPYPVRPAKLSSCNESLVSAAGITPSEYTHVMFSEGVDVRVGALEELR